MEVKIIVNEEEYAGSEVLPPAVLRAYLTIYSSWKSVCRYPPAHQQSARSLYLTFGQKKCTLPRDSAPGTVWPVRCPGADPAIHGTEGGFPDDENGG